MGTIADSLFSALMSWVRALVNDFWAIFSSERTTILEFLGKNWIGIVIILLAVGLVADWLIWLLRWQPYHLWAQRVRRLFGIKAPEDEAEQPRARAARMPQRPRQVEPQPEEEWFPPQGAALRAQDEQIAMENAQSVPDASLGAYPGMRYDGSRTAVPQREMSETQRYAAVHSEGPGAAEVARRRAEIEAWQLQLQEEARAKAEAEQARLVRQAQEAERERRAREAEAAAEAERQRQAQQARAAQEQYERELAEYERQREQYEREMAEYQRQKAEYDAQMALLAQQQAAQQGGAQYAPYDEAYDAQAYAQSEDASAPAGGAEDEGRRKNGALMQRMAKAMRMIEPEESEISSIASLPPRVDMREAYGPAKQPRGGAKRRR